MSWDANVCIFVYLILIEIKNKKQIYTNIKEKKKEKRK